MNPNDGHHELDREECLRLLSRVPIGRVVHTRHALPAVLPVNFSLDTDSAVVMRTSADSELAAAIDGVVIAFEADEVDAAAHSGWSVVVTGRAALVIDPVERGRLRPYRAALLAGLARGGFHPGRARAGDRPSAGRRALRLRAGAVLLLIIAAAREMLRAAVERRSRGLRMSRIGALRTNSVNQQDRTPISSVIRPHSTPGAATS